MDQSHYRGESLGLERHDNGVFELCFDHQRESINIFDQATLDELRAVVGLLQEARDVRGLLVSSSKEAFIVGADIGAFGKLFQLSEDEGRAWSLGTNALFNAIEDLPFPSVCAIQGYALGGGFEMALATDYRVAATGAVVGLPEVGLGIIPGFGGTVRLPRLIGADTALEWIAGAAQQRAEAALAAHAIDAVVAPELLREAALRTLERAAAGVFDWRARRAQKKAPLALPPAEAAMVFETAAGLIAQRAGRHLPAPLAALASVRRAAARERDAAIVIEAEEFNRVARTPAASALIGLFLNDQAIKRIARKRGAAAQPVSRAAVIGAGIMGGGIAYQSALRGVPVVLKDVQEKGLEAGMAEAGKLLATQVERGKLKPAKAAAVLSSIRPTLSFSDEFSTVDVVVEAVVENPRVKQAVLAEVEDRLRPDAVLCSNTSSISIDFLASALKRPQNFLGMHFFNPVHRMPLVEVVRGSASSEAAVATVVAYAVAMGKQPIVVRDCPGFLVNRILFPYLTGLLLLLRDGADFARVDQAMERFGWPMGPAYLCDVIGIDTCHHVAEVLAAGYPDRMAMPGFRSALDLLYEQRRLGQKSGAGFYRYESDPKGKPRKLVDEETPRLLGTVQPDGSRDFSEEEIVERMMLPMILEAARCLEQDVVSTPAEVDMGLVLGLGFPAHFGGALKYADLQGLDQVVEQCTRRRGLGPLYAPPPDLLRRAADSAAYFPA